MCKLMGQKYIFKLDREVILDPVRILQTMLTNIETGVKDMSVRREYETPEAPCKLKLFISRAKFGHFRNVFY